MNATLVIARRELAEKRFVFVTALAFLALALLVPFMPGVHEGERAGALLIASLILSAALTVGLAAILGGSIVGRELADGRLSFYFSKPLPATSIWWGKLIAAATLVLASFVIAGLPALVAGGAAGLQTWTSQGPAAIFGWILTAAVAMFLVAHVIGTFVRSRSAWFLFDFVAAVICGTAMSMLARALLAGFAATLTMRVFEAFAAFAALATIAAGAWQIEHGRTDRKRSHMELSRFLWMAIGCGVLVAAGFVMWVTAVRPGDLNVDTARPSGADWAYITGVAKNKIDYRASFLYNIRNDHAVRIPVPRPWWSAIAFTGDGSKAFWVSESGGVYDVWTIRLTDANPKPVKTPILLKQFSFFHTTPDGSRLEVVDHGIQSMYDVRTGNLLSARKFAASPRPAPLRTGQWSVDIGNGRSVVAVKVGSAVMEGGKVIRSEQGIWPAYSARGGVPLLAYTSKQLVIWNPLTGERRAIR